MIKAVLQIIAVLLELVPKLLEYARASAKSREQSTKDTRNDAAIAEAQKGLDRPKP